MTNTYIQTDTHTHLHPYTQTDKQIDRQIDRQRDICTDRHVYIQAYVGLLNVAYVGILSNYVNLM